MIRCEICGATPSTKVTLYRQNALGEVGVWRCGEHNEKPLDPETQRLVDTINDKGLP